VDRLAAFYHTKGFIDARVGRPVITHDEQGIYIDFPIVEGQRFGVGKVEVAGEDVEAEPDLLASLKLADEEFFNREILAKDLERVTDFFTAQGYAFAEVVPRISKDESSLTVSIVYEVHKGEPVNFAKINISGNTKTRDKVIRRELQVVEGARYSKSRLQRSESNLRRLDYFELVEMETSKADRPDRMNVDVKVQEKPTRFMSLGGGFSSADKLFAMAQIAERNLFGRGQTLQFQGQFGSVASRFSLKFTEPWLFDIPLTSTVEAYNWSRDYDEFNKDSLGGKLAFGYPVWDYTRVYVSYVYDDSEVSNVSENASTFIKDQEGTIVSSVISTTLRRDNRDHTFLTTRGSDNSLTLDYAGGVLGGDSAFFKGILNSSWYVPLFWKFVGFLHGKYGIIEGFSGGIIPIYERFYLGGINSLRGWDSGDVSPRDPETGDRIGGETMILFNVELLWPLVEKIGLRGVVFYDAGNSYLTPDDFDISDLKTDVGAGIRWHSPMGPLRLEYGYKLNPESGESRGNFQFSMGVFF
jgi:outer membrane protein insertion porin family